MGFSASCGLGASSARGASCGLASGWLRPSTWFLSATYCAARGGVVFAHAGTMPSALLLPEQAASRVPKINNATTGPMGLLPRPEEKT